MGWGWGKQFPTPIFPKSPDVVLSTPLSPWRGVGGEASCSLSAKFISLLIEKISKIYTLTLFNSYVWPFFLIICNDCLILQRI